MLNQGSIISKVQIQQNKKKMFKKMKYFITRVD